MILCKNSGQNSRTQPRTSNTSFAKMCSFWVTDFSVREYYFFCNFLHRSLIYNPDNLSIQKVDPKMLFGISTWKPLVNMLYLPVLFNRFMLIVKIVIDDFQRFINTHCSSFFEFSFDVSVEVSRSDFKIYIYCCIWKFESYKYLSPELLMMVTISSSW